MNAAAVWSSIMRHLHGNPNHLHMIKTSRQQHITPNEPVLSRRAEETTSRRYCVRNDTEDWREGSTYSERFCNRAALCLLLLCLLNWLHTWTEWSHKASLWEMSLLCYSCWNWAVLRLMFVKLSEMVLFVAVYSELAGHISEFIAWTGGSVLLQLVCWTFFCFRY